MTEQDQPMWAPKLYGRQWEVFNSRAGILLVDGTRWAGKTWVVLHRIVRHLWETPNAQVGIFAKSVKLAKDGGSWEMLLKHTLPEWLNANIVGQTGLPMELLTRNAEGEPDAKVDANTRTAYFEVRNCYGGTSQCMLFSITHDSEIEEKIKNKNFSCLWFVELSMYKDRRLLTITIQSLRMPGLAHLEEQFCQWIGDTNPDVDAGRNSWIYQVFYKERGDFLAGKSLPEGLDESEIKALSECYKMMDVIRMDWRENPTFTPRRHALLLGTCHGDRALKESYYDGVWGDGGFKAEKHFTGYFIKTKHVVGGGEGEGDQIDVSKNTVELICGWDLGGINHSWSLWEKTLRLIGGKETSCWNLLDELLSIHERIMLEDFTEQVLVKMREVERVSGRKFTFRHWSDEDAIKVWRPNVGAFDYQTVYSASRGEINLLGVSKPPHSKQARVRLFKKLFRDGRMYVSARCVHSIATFENLRKDKKDYLVGDDEWIHTFSSASYPVFAESQDELADETFAPVASEHDPASTLQIASV